MTEQDLQVILAEGEGYKIEFKESPSGLAKEMVAFANADGGRIFLGITDAKEVQGVRITNRLKSQIQNIARDCDPSVTIRLEEFKNILVVRVPEGDDKPYRCSGGFYLRQGANSQKLDRNEILALVTSLGKVKFDELIHKDFNYHAHFNQDKFHHFLRLADIDSALPEEALLQNLSVAEKQEGRLYFNNTGILFFADSLEHFYLHTSVTCVLYKGTERFNVIDKREYNDDIVSSVNSAMKFLKQYIPVRQEMTGEPQRKDIPEIPYEALREAIINAVAHRDYFEKGANTKIEMFDDRIEISNPGGLAPGLTVADFGTRSVLRNPTIANLLDKINYIEKLGTGITKIRNLLEQYHLLPAEFDFNSFFTVTFYRAFKQAHLSFRDRMEKEPAIHETFDNTFKKRFQKKFNMKEQKVDRYVALLKDISSNIPVDYDRFERKFDISRSTVKRDISDLKDLNLIEFTGPKKSGKYIVTKEGKKIIRDLHLRPPE